MWVSHMLAGVRSARNTKPPVVVVAARSETRQPKTGQRLIQCNVSGNSTVCLDGTDVHLNS